MSQEKTESIVWADCIDIRNDFINGLDTAKQSLGALGLTFAANQANEEKAKVDKALNMLFFLEREVNDHGHPGLIENRVRDEVIDIDNIATAYELQVVHTRALATLAEILEGVQ